MGMYIVLATVFAFWWIFFLAALYFPIQQLNESHQRRDCQYGFSSVIQISFKSVLAKFLNFFESKLFAKRLAVSGIRSGVSWVAAQYPYHYTNTSCWKIWIKIKFIRFQWEKWQAWKLIAINCWNIWTNKYFFA